MCLGRLGTDLLYALYTHIRPFNRPTDRHGIDNYKDWVKRILCLSITRCEAPSAFDIKIDYDFVCDGLPHRKFMFDMHYQNRMRFHVHTIYYLSWKSLTHIWCFSVGCARGSTNEIRNIHPQKTPLAIFVCDRTEWSLPSISTHPLRVHAFHVWFHILKMPFILLHASSIFNFVKLQ